MLRTRDISRKNVMVSWELQGYTQKKNIHSITLQNISVTSNLVRIRQRSQRESDSAPSSSRRVDVGAPPCPTYIVLGGVEHFNFLFKKVVFRGSYGDIV